MLRWLAPLAAVALAHSSAQAAPAMIRTEPDEEAPEPPDRSLRVAPTAQVLIFDPFDGVSRFGTGVFAAYEFMITRGFFLGINLSYRIYPGREQLHQLGYGLLMRHYLTGVDDEEAIFMPFLEYGLLLQMHFLSDRDGTGTSHDTRLGAGTDLRIGPTKWLVGANWHFSRLTLFEHEGFKMDYVELDVGYRFDW